MEINRTNNRIKLKDGRSLGYAEYGNPDGKPAFYFHGFPGSRLDWLISDPYDIASELNIRIIALDRPGMGLSDSKSNREIPDWPDDVVEVAGELKLESFSVIGVSGGGPYSAACAYKIPERLKTVLLVSSMGPSNAPQMKEGISWTIPGKSFINRKILLMLFNLGLQRDPAKFVTRSKAQFPEPDRIILDKPEVAQIYIDMLREAFRSGASGVDYEAQLYKGLWGFELKNITSKVNLWHGELDENVPFSVGHYLADEIPNCQATFYKEEAHLSTAYNHIREILGVLVS